jgi:hypothetical protein
MRRSTCNESHIIVLEDELAFEARGGRPPPLSEVKLLIPYPRRTRKLGAKDEYAAAQRIDCSMQINTNLFSLDARCPTESLWRFIGYSQDFQRTSNSPCTRRVASIIGAVDT